MRLVLTPERVVLAEARRTLTSLSLYGFASTQVVVNRVFPDAATGAPSGQPPARPTPGARPGTRPSSRGWSRCASRSPACRWSHAPYLDHEPIGADALDELAPRPAPARGHRPRSRRVAAAGHDGRAHRPPASCCALPLPLVSAADVDLGRRGDELVVTVGEHRRVLSLPAALQRCVVTGASVRDGMLRVRSSPTRRCGPAMAEPQDTAADRAAAGTVADETARLVEALGVWATSVSPPPVRRRPPRPPARRGADAAAAGPTASDDDARDDTGAHDAPAADSQQEPRSEAPYDVGRCAHCGARTGVGQAVSCQVCPICQGIALLRSVRPETVDRLADLAGAVAATLRDVAATSGPARTSTARPHGGRPRSGQGRGRRGQEQVDRCAAWTGYGPGHPGRRRRQQRRRRRARDARRSAWTSAAPRSTEAWSTATGT